MNRLASFLGIQRSVAGLLGMVILVGIGEKMAERFLPVYLVALGGGALAVGLMSGLDNLLSALYSFPGGYCAERFGTKKSLFLFNIIAMTGFAIVVLFPSWPVVIAASFLFISWTALSLPATVGLLSAVLPKNKRTMGMSVHSLVRRIPMFVGPLIGGACISAFGIQSGIKAGFITALALAVLATVLQQKLIADDGTGRNPAGKKSVPTANPLHLYREMPPALKRLLISDILIRFCEQIPYAFVVIWCMQTISHPVTAFGFGILTTVEMVTAMLIYIPVAYLADRTEKKPFVVLTFLFFSLFPLVLLFSRTFPALVVAFFLRGLKEFGEPTRKALIMELAPDHCKAGMFGLYYLMRDSVVSVAAFSGALLWMKSPAVNLVTAFCFGIAGTVWFALSGRNAST